MVHKKTVTISMNFYCIFIDKDLPRIIKTSQQLNFNNIAEVLKNY